MSVLFDDLPRPPANPAPGVVHLPGRIPVGEQARIVAECRELGLGPVPYRRPVTAGGAMSVSALSLGWHWCARPYGYHRRAVDVNGAEVPPLPGWLADLASGAAAAARDVDPSVGDIRPDAALVNFYGPGAAMGVHRDADEEADAPVVSISLGDSAVFRFAEERHGRFAEERYGGSAGEEHGAPVEGTDAAEPVWHRLQLLSGDVLVFGGPARAMPHGVPKVLPGTGPAGIGLGGRLNVTVRQVRR
ncbi:alpha-ketoglutarate-dependent dioxygenase AlkB [Corynebacterium sp. 335C]